MFGLFKKKEVKKEPKYNPYARIKKDSMWTEKYCNEDDFTNPKLKLLANQLLSALSWCNSDVDYKQLPSTQETRVRGNPICLGGRDGESFIYNTGLVEEVTNLDESVVTLRFPDRLNCHSHDLRILINKYVTEAQEKYKTLVNHKTKFTIVKVSDIELQVVVYFIGEYKDGVRP